MAVSRRSCRALAIAFACALTCVARVHASGHGPVFGGATPTLGKGGWALDQAWMGQIMEGADAGELLRTMISFGITEKLQISGSVPVALGSDAGTMPSGRMMAMMSGNPDIETLLGWRFHTRPVGQSARFESTMYVGALAPIDKMRGGVRASPAAYIAIATGYASRAHYVWGGVSHVRHAEESGDRLGNVTSFTLVYGYRPPAWRRDYPKPDLRLFVEATADATARARHQGSTMTATGSRVALVGPTLLLLYKAYAVEGGVQFPLYQRTNGLQADERFRFGVNFTYFFWPGKGKGH